MFESDDTLFTFVVEYAKPAQFVSILGSWDNFHIPYALKQDTRCGKTTWRRYSDFKSITCDGDRIRDAADKRDGSLKMGGVYWYYYQIDNETEYCDPSMPTTRTCPFLPGQEVNVLEVPRQQASACPSASSSVSLDVYTLDPTDKYRSSPSSGGKALPPPARPSSLQTLLSAVASWVSQSPAHSMVQQDTITFSCSSSGLSKARPRSILNKAPSSPNNPSTNETSPTRTRFLTFRPSTAPQISGSKKNVSTGPIRTSRTAGSSQDVLRPRTSWQKFKHSAGSVSSSISCNFFPAFSASPCSSRRGRDVSVHRSQLPEITTPSSWSKIPIDFLSRSRPISRPGSSLQLDLGRPASTDFTLSFSEVGLIDADVIEFPESAGTSTGRQKHGSDAYHSNTVSTRSSFFPSLGSTNECTDEFSQSQPMTPERSNFIFKPDLDKTVHADLESKQTSWYASPGENASVLTLQNVNKLPDDSLATPAKFSAGGSHLASRRVQDWNQNVDNARSAMDDLCADMGYLSAIIQ